jgi:Recombination endonuclease VII
MTTLLVDGEASRDEQRALVADGKKQCTGCLEVKSLDDFGQTEKGLAGRASQCNTCKAARSRQYRADNPEPHKGWDSDRYQRRKREIKNSRYLKAYGVSLDRFEEMVAEQQGGCALCGKVPDGPHNTGVLHMDHDHETGVSRSPLCHDCNNGLGRFLDDPELLERAAAYIRSFR